MLERALEKGAGLRALSFADQKPAQVVQRLGSPPLVVTRRRRKLELAPSVLYHPLLDVSLPELQMRAALAWRLGNRILPEQEGIAPHPIPFHAEHPPGQDQNHPGRRRAPERPLPGPR